ncbi:hypothetical protein [Myxosarcina sp. GI1(2024)]
MFKENNILQSLFESVIFDDDLFLDKRICIFGKIASENLIIGNSETNSLALSKVEVESIAVANTSAIAAAEVEAIVVADGIAVGIDNSGRINTGRGDDLIIGVAETNSLALSQIEVESIAVANTSAIAAAEVEAIVVADGIAVGIDNSGRINTGRGDDLIIGVADINPSALVTATANARAIGDASNSDAFTSTLAITLDSIGIGINNSGRIETGKGDDRIIGYGTSIGILNGEIKAGKGNDYIHAAKIESDPLTGNISFLPDQTDAIKNAKIFGEEGNDFFEIGGFSGNVYLDGGRDRDVLKVSNDIENYTIIAGSSTNKTLTFENSDSILTVKNIEEFYLGNETELYTFEDFV